MKKCLCLSVLLLFGCNNHAVEKRPAGPLNHADTLKSIDSADKRMSLSDSVIISLLSNDSSFKTLHAWRVTRLDSTQKSLEIMWNASKNWDTAIAGQIPNEPAMYCDTYMIRYSILLKGKATIDNSGKIQKQSGMDTVFQFFKPACGLQDGDFSQLNFAAEDEAENIYFFCDSTKLLDRPYGDSIVAKQRKKQILKSDIIADIQQYPVNNKSEIEHICAFAHILGKGDKNGWAEIYYLSMGHEYEEGLGTRTTREFDVNLVNAEQ